MHAVVTSAIQQTVLAHYGLPIWQAICQRAATSVGRPGEAYDRAGLCSFDLARAASAQLNLPRSELLEACGEFWLDTVLCEQPASGSWDADWPELPADAPQLGRMHEVYRLARQALPRIGVDACSVLPTGHGALEVQVAGAGALLREMLVGVCKALSRAAGVAAAVHVITPEETRGLALHRVELRAC